MKSIEPNRPISEKERAVLIAALQRAPRRSEALSFLPTVGSLQVNGLCECGCGSVSFASAAIHEHPYIVADAIADSVHGPIGVIVRAVPSQIVELELYSLGAEPSEAWPAAGTIRPWESGHTGHATLQVGGPASGGSAA